MFKKKKKFLFSTEETKSYFPQNIYPLFLFGRQNFRAVCMQRDSFLRVPLLMLFIILSKQANKSTKVNE